MRLPTADDWRSILTENRAADVDYRWSLNPYRGCATACAFCEARGSFSYLGLDADRAFETAIVARPEAARVLREVFEHPAWEGETITFSGLTDAYQALEGQLRLTRACLEVCLLFRNPVRIVTKMSLVERDLDLLVALAKEARLHVDVSIAFADDAMGRALEPGAPGIAERMRVVARLARAGLSVGVMAAPIFLELNDGSIASLLERAADAGARTATWRFARLPPTMAEVFAARLRAHDATITDRVIAQLGADSSVVDAALRATCQRVGLEARPCHKRRELATTFSRTKRQLRLPLQI